jgi:hypothetical protein
MSPAARRALPTAEQKQSPATRRGSHLLRCSASAVLLALLTALTRTVLLLLLLAWLLLLTATLLLTTLLPALLLLARLLVRILILVHCVSFQRSRSPPEHLGNVPPLRSVPHKAARRRGTTT